MLIFLSLKKTQEFFENLKFEKIVKIKQFCAHDRRGRETVVY